MLRSRYKMTGLRGPQSSLIQASHSPTAMVSTRQECASLPSLKRKRSEEDIDDRVEIASETQKSKIRFTNKRRIGRIETSFNGSDTRGKEEENKTTNEEYIPGGSSKILPLSKHNLRLFDRDARGTMDSSTNSLKRSVSVSQSQTTRSQASINANSLYRSKHLSAYKIYFHSDTPEEVQTAADSILDASISDQRRTELRSIARVLRQDHLEKVRAQGSEDNFVSPLHAALKSLRFKHAALGKEDKWEENLKPKVQDKIIKSFNLGAKFRLLGKGENTPAQSQERQQQSMHAYVSPESSSFDKDRQAEQAKAMPPAPVYISRQAINFHVKTPHPDIALGICTEDLLSAIAHDKVSRTLASEVFKYLQNEMIEREPGDPLEPALIPVPSSSALTLAFPFAVVEGKAYSTGKQIFEAENQAAVSAACALKIQIDLDSLVSCVSTIQDLSTANVTAAAQPDADGTFSPLLFFTITIQGPIHELWVHWTVLREGLRMYESSLLDSCNVLLLPQATSFMEKVNNVCQWGTGSFMDSIVKRMRIITENAKD